MSGRTIRRAMLPLAILLLAAAPKPAGTTLRYRFKAGTKLEYVIEQQARTKVRMKGKEQEMSMKQTLDLTWKVKAVDKAGKAQIVQSFDRVRLTFDAPMGKVEYDSQDGKVPEGPVGEHLAPVMKGLVGLEVALSMDALGQVDNVEIHEKGAQGLKGIEEIPGVGELFSKEWIKKMIAQSGLVVPKEPAVKGTAWARKIRNNMNFGHVTVESDYTYDGPITRDGKKVEHIPFKMILTLEPDPNIPVPVKFREATGSGSAYFDNVRGWLVEVALAQSMTLDIGRDSMMIRQSIDIKLKP
jgi:hypothetical protein